MPGTSCASKRPRLSTVLLRLIGIIVLLGLRILLLRRIWLLIGIVIPLLRRIWLLSGIAVGSRDRVAVAII